MRAPVSVLFGCVLGFAHTLGEFGVVLMVDGKIPDETQVLSIAIYDHVEAFEYAEAHRLAGGLLVLSFVLLWAGEARLLARVTRRSARLLDLRQGKRLYAQVKRVAIID